MIQQPLRLSRFLTPLGFLAAAILSSCETSRMAFEGNPMPEAQVTANLQVVSPKTAYDTPPKFVKGYAPFFPENEPKTRHIGYAMAEFTVSTNGTINSVRILKATNLNFAEEAGYTVRDWHFTPARKNGQPVPVRVRLPFTFRET